MIHSLLANLPSHPSSVLGAPELKPRAQTNNEWTWSFAVALGGNYYFISLDQLVFKSISLPFNNTQPLVSGKK